jgi:hypothetical protein
MIRERLRGARYLLNDLGYALGRLPRRLRGEDAPARDGGEPAPPATEDGERHRWVLPAAAGLVVLVVAVGLIATVRGGDEAPADDAIPLVPADALAYVHADLDPGSEQYEQAAALAERLPLVSRQVIRLLSGLAAPGGGSGPTDFEEWFGGEVALALVPTDSGAEVVQLFEVADEAGARDYGGDDATIVDGFLVVGADAGVEAVTATARSGNGGRVGGGGSLADDPDAQDVREALPDERLADAFLSEAGVDELVADPGASLATVEPFVDAEATRGVGAAVVATDDGLELEIRSALDPERSSSDPGFFGAFPGFEPSLTSDIAPNALAYLGFGDPEQTVEALLRQASLEAPELAAAFSDLFERLREVGDVSLRGDLLPALGDEAALVLDLAREPGAEEPEIPGLVPEPLPGQPAPLVPRQPTPVVELIAGGVDEERADSALSELEQPIAEALGVDLSYEVFDSKLVVGTSPAAVERVTEGEGGLDQDERYRRATEGLADEPSLIAYLNVSRLLELAELAGLAEDPAYATFADDLHELEALGVGVTASSDELATDARLLIGEERRERDPGPSVPGN